MEFTFGIITDGSHDDRIAAIVDSIVWQDIPENKYEIIIVGNTNYIPEHPLNIKYIEFDEKAHPGGTAWITRKKNLINKHARFNNVVFMHDYIFLREGWYEGFKVFGDDWNICMNVILNYDGTRYRDWVVWEYQKYNKPIIFLPQYTFNRTEDMYISGAYWVSKKNVIADIPFDESLHWGQSEDVIWSRKAIPSYGYKMNMFSAVQLLKQKDVVAIRAPELR